MADPLHHLLPSELQIIVFQLILSSDDGLADQPTLEQYPLWGWREARSVARRIDAVRFGRLRLAMPHNVTLRSAYMRVIRKRTIDQCINRLHGAYSLQSSVHRFCHTLFLSGFPAALWHSTFGVVNDHWVDRTYGNAQHFGALIARAAYIPGTAMDFTHHLTGNAHVLLPSAFGANIHPVVGDGTWFSSLMHAGAPSKLELLLNDEEIMFLCSTAFMYYAEFKHWLSSGFPQQPVLLDATGHPRPPPINVSLPWQLRDNGRATLMIRVLVRLVTDRVYSGLDTTHSLTLGSNWALSFPRSTALRRLMSLEPEELPFDELLDALTFH